MPCGITLVLGTRLPAPEGGRGKGGKGAPGSVCAASQGSACKSSQLSGSSSKDSALMASSGEGRRGGVEWLGAAI